MAAFWPIWRKNESDARNAGWTRNAQGEKTTKKEVMITRMPDGHQRRGGNWITQRGKCRSIGPMTTEGTAFLRKRVQARSRSWEKEKIPCRVTCKFREEKKEKMEREEEERFAHPHYAKESSRPPKTHKEWKRETEMAGKGGACQQNGGWTQLRIPG